MIPIPVGPIVIGKDGRGERIELVARVYREGIARSDGGTSYVRARLTHAKGCWMGFFQPTANDLTAGQAVRVEARRLRHVVAEDSFRIERWAPLPAHQERVLRLDLLPSAICPHPWLVENLVEMLDRMTIPSLREFVAGALCEQTVRDRYLTAPASRHAHHNFPGGLIRHSMEVAGFVAGFGRLSDTERELGSAAGLLHDIGKIRTYDAVESDLGDLLGHELLTLEMLAS